MIKGYSVEQLQSLVFVCAYLLLLVIVLYYFVSNYFKPVSFKYFYYKLFRKDIYEYGEVKSSDPGMDSLARRNKITNEVQFVLWRAGEQGHTEDYWCNYSSYWWPLFISNK